MTTESEGKDQQQQGFQNCHLQILRSLYSSDAECSDKRGLGGNNEEEKATGNKADEKVIESEEESPVSSELWDLICRFLQQRRGYIPRLQRQIHWNDIFSEASSRLDLFMSAYAEEEAQSSYRAPSFTPRNLAFSAVKRRSLSTPNSHTNSSLTPLTNNRNQNNSQELKKVSITSWNFISRIVKRRQDKCAKLCDAFRSEPFMQALLDEAEERCEVLKFKLKALKKNQLTTDAGNFESKRNRSSTPLHSPPAKRIKFDISRDKKCATGISFFQRVASSPEHIKLDENSHFNYSNSIMQIQIKLNLWSELSNSVKTVVEVGNK